MTKPCWEYSNVTPVAPPLPIPYGTHHTKMLVALYPEKVRVAIFTANFLSNDWNAKTQGVWCQDFGLKVLADSDDEEDKGVARESLASANDFEADLIHYLSSLGAQVKLFCGELARFDFSAARVALVPSVPGVHKGKGKHATPVWLMQWVLSVWVRMEFCRYGSIRASPCAQVRTVVFDRTWGGEILAGFSLWHVC
jgi:hypothetical protein